MGGLKDFLIVKMVTVIVMLLLVGAAGGLEEEDNLAMESRRGSVDDDYDFAAFLAKAGEVLGDPGGDWGNRVEEAVPRVRISQSRTAPNLRGAQSRKGNRGVSASQLEGVGRTRGGGQSSQFQVDPLANVTAGRPTTGEIVDRLGFNIWPIITILTDVTGGVAAATQ